jgi:hypothetical protein
MSARCIMASISLRAAVRPTTIAAQYSDRNGSSYIGRLTVPGSSRPSAQGLAFATRRPALLSGNFGGRRVDAMLLGRGNGL